MKNKSLISVLLLSLFLVLNISRSNCQTSWGQWQTSSCYKGLDYSIKKGDYNEYAKKYYWHIKFRNRYQSKASFSYKITESYITSAKGTDRTSISAGNESSSSFFLVADANSVKIFIDSMRFGEDDWGSKYAQCDN